MARTYAFESSKTPPPAPGVVPSRAVPVAKNNQGAKKRGGVAGAKKIRLNELPMFSRQLSAMLSSGMPVVQTLQALEDQTNNKAFRAVIERIRGQIEGGSNFSDALTPYPEIFDELYVGLIRAGEQGGALGATAGRVADFLEASSRLRHKVKAAMTYPAVVITVALVLAFGMITFIVPTFAAMFSDFGAPLPGPTQFLVDMSVFIKQQKWLLIAGVVAAVWGFKKWRKSPKGAYQWDQFCLNMPVFGPLTRKVGVSRFASTFSQLLHSGVPILKSLEIVAMATGNKVLGGVLLNSRAVVERGEQLSSALLQSGQYPKIVTHMLAAGEKTGKMEDMLDKISEFYDSEVESSLAGLTAMLEPLLMVFLGVVIGGIVLCMFLPIFKMSQVVNF